MAVVSLTGGEECLVDEADLHLLEGGRWFAHRPANGFVYAASGKHGRLLMHRLLTGVGKGLSVDHINGNGLDNRRANLRVCTQAQNLRNRRRMSNSAHPYKGIGQSRHKTRYVAKLRFNGKRETIGWFDTAEEAAAAYDICAVLRFGQFACLNFPHVFPEISQRSA